MTSRVCQILENWNDGQPEPRGAVYGGDIGCRFADAAASVVAYWNADQLDAQPINAVVLKGPPTLAVEILSPSNTVEEINE